MVILTAGAVGMTAATVLCMALGIHNGLNPADIPTIRELFPSLRVGDFLPEPLERAQALGFVAGAYLMTIALVAFPELDSRVPNKAALFFRILCAAAIVGYLVFGQDAFQMPARFYGAIRAVWLPEKPALWGLAFLLAASPILIHSSVARQRAERINAALATVALLLLCARISFFDAPHGLRTDANNHHNSAVLHSVVQAAFGQIPYVDFVPQYGGYGLFAVPFFRLGLDPWTALCLFLFVCCVASIGSMATAVALTARSWAAGAYAGIVAFWLCVDFRTALTYFQGMPIRLLFPSLLLLLFAIYPRSPALIATISGFLIPMAVYWNPETGLVCLGAVLSYLFFDAVINWRQGELTLGKTCKPLILFLAACFVTTTSCSAGFLFFYHTLPIADFLFHGMVFSKYGFFNLPIPLLDIWIPAALAFCLMLSFPHSNSSDCQSLNKARFGYFCAMLFAGLFFYYQGRSYTGNLVGFLFTIVCGIFVWLWRDSDSHAAIRSRGIVSVVQFATPGRDVVVFMFGIAAAALAGNSFIAAPFMNPFAKTVHPEDQALGTFIRDESKGFDTAFILSPQAWRLHLISGVPPPKTVPPQSGLLSHRQEEETIRAAEPESGYALFVDWKYFEHKTTLAGRFQDNLRARLDSQWKRGESLNLPSGEFTVLKNP